MEIGMGQHGEAGTGRMKIKSADETAEAMLGQLLADLDVKAGDQLLVLLNGAGATTLMELFIIFRRVHQVCQARQIKVARARVAEFLTVQEMAGFQMCIARMDEELLKLWDAPCDTPYFTVR
jgi:dihydroxyacetone kinase-like protein